MRTVTSPSLDGLNWSKIRAIARDVSASGPIEDVITASVPELVSPDHRRRMLGTYLLGFTAAERPANLTILRERVAADPSWEVQEVLAQGFDAYCAAVGYDAALPTIDAWLADPQANVRRAVSEGLRPWTSKSRAYFHQKPGEAIRRLAALRADPSDYVRHSAGNALRDIRRAHGSLVESETATWDVGDARVAFTYARVQKVR